MANSKKTSKSVAKLAAQTLRDNKSSKIQKHLAGSVLAQSKTSKQTSKKIEAELSAILHSDKYNETTRTFAASLLSQSDSSN
ncbi:hypothetical protein [Shewanella gelidii]|uniref:Uncharacterized protein n=1 Tax=Shewanella gelidii TaxID=1642821 RepID=A0A917JYY1_9GAMM|nr:hypothetical protein [Shewanella gelidii]MCL1098084.1 hypothetical protein [Shewanella gelidii]MCL1098091.1 hypothetical protein [Shewanella gelidii]GGI93536.1 hypothetical protein GCM10009332_33480 [Shewanella gelidii]